MGRQLIKETLSYLCFLVHSSSSGILLYVLSQLGTRWHRWPGLYYSPVPFHSAEGKDLINA